MKYLSAVDGPTIYNAEGEKMLYCYLDDDLLGWQFFSFTRHQYPHRIMWDRINPSIKMHFYGHGQIGSIVGNPERKFAILVETEEICPDVYAKLYNDPSLANQFDGVFTHSEKLLNKYENAFFIPAGGVWYGHTPYGGKVSNDLYLQKTKGISIVSSNKAMCDLHQLRINIAQSLKETKGADTFGTFDGGKYVSISETLESYRYSIIIENTVSPYCFTEKILNCFLSMTIPIYLGAPKIGEFFNADGIVQMTLHDAEKNLSDIISMCTEKYYNDHIDAIIDNFNRVMKYSCQEDYITAKYSDMFI